ncbi:hypothetical protein [Nocardia gipuzkoensis]
MHYAEPVACETLDVEPLGIDEGEELEVLQAADEHLLAVESLLRSLGEQVRGKPPVRRAIAG